jgi:hypothetical protein
MRDELMRKIVCGLVGLSLGLAACGEIETGDAVVDAGGNPLATPVAAVYGDETLSPEAASLDRQQLLDDLRILSADDMEGRGAGTEGSARARAYIIDRLTQIGVAPMAGDYEHGFDYTSRRRPGETFHGTNIIGLIEGTGSSERVMVLTAHYDHVGIHDDAIYNGADDNASGVAAVLAAAADFVATPPTHDVIVVLFDAEERGLQGAGHFVANPPVDQARIAFNLNLDMVAMSDERNLWVVGTHSFPVLLPIAERVAASAPVNFPTGFDDPADPETDWTMLSDQGAFHAEGIPNIYLGVDFHPHYHEPSDDYENMTLDFFQDAAVTIVSFARATEAELDMIAEASGR